MQEEKRKYNKASDVNVKKLIKMINTDKVKPYTTAIKNALELSWNTTKKLIKDNPDIEAAMLLRREEITEFAEESIPDILKNADYKTRSQMIQWVLKTRDERFKEKQEVKHEGINIQIKGVEL